MTVLMKTIIALIVLFAQTQLIDLGTWVLSPLSQRPNEELVVVMLVGPVFMNAGQFWLNDNMLKGRMEIGYEEVGEVKGKLFEGSIEKGSIEPTERK